MSDNVRISLIWAAAVVLVFFALSSCERTSYEEQTARQRQLVEAGFTASEIGCMKPTSYNQVQCALRAAKESTNE